MALYRDNIDRSIIDQEDMNQKYKYVDIDDVKSMLDEIENKINECITLFKIETLTECLSELEDLSQKLY